MDEAQAEVEDDPSVTIEVDVDSAGLPGFEGLKIEGRVDELPPLRPGEVRFCGMTLTPPLAELLQTLLRLWWEWARPAQDAYDTWTRQRLLEAQQAKAAKAGQATQPAKKNRVNANKKGNAKGASTKATAPKPVTPEDSIEIETRDMAHLREHHISAADVKSLIAQIAALLQLTLSPVRLELPQDVPTNDGVEPFIISAPDPRVGLHGRQGLRASRPLAAWTLIGTYRSLCMPSKVYEKLLWIPPQGWEQLKWRGMLESYCLDDRVWGEHEVKVKGAGSTALQMMVSGLAYGNVTALCNDPCMEDPMEGPEVYNKYKHNGNTIVVFINIRNFPVPFMVTVKPVQQGEELLYTYGWEYWRTQSENSKIMHTTATLHAELAAAKAAAAASKAAAAAAAAALAAVASQQPAAAAAAAGTQQQEGAAAGACGAAVAPLPQQVSMQPAAPLPFPPIGSQLVIGSAAGAGAAGEAASGQLTQEWRDKALSDYELEVLQVLAAHPMGLKVKKLPKYEGVAPDGSRVRLYQYCSQMNFFNARHHLFSWRGSGSTEVILLKPGVAEQRGLGHLVPQPKAQQPKPPLPVPRPTWQQQQQPGRLGPQYPPQRQQHPQQYQHHAAMRNQQQHGQQYGARPLWQQPAAAAAAAYSAAAAGLGSDSDDEPDMGVVARGRNSKQQRSSRQASDSDSDDNLHTGLRGMNNRPRKPAASSKPPAAAAAAAAGEDSDDSLPDMGNTARSGRQQQQHSSCSRWRDGGATSAGRGTKPQPRPRAAAAAASDEEGELPGMDRSSPSRSRSRSCSPYRAASRSYHARSRSRSRSPSRARSSRHRSSRRARRSRSGSRDRSRERRRSQERRRRSRSRERRRSRSSHRRSRSRDGGGLRAGSDGRREQQRGRSESVSAAPSQREESVGRSWW